MLHHFARSTTCIFFLWHHDAICETDDYIELKTKSESPIGLSYIVDAMHMLSFGTPTNAKINKIVAWP